MPRIFTATDDDGDQLDVSVHTDGYYFTTRDTDTTYRTVVVPGEDAVRLAWEILAKAPQFEPKPDPEPEPEPDTTLTTEQRQREEALASARVALANGGTLLNKGSRVDPGTAALLVAIAGYVETGQRDYLTDQMVDRDQPTR